MQERLARIHGRINRETAHCGGKAAANSIGVLFEARAVSRWDRRCVPEPRT